MPTKLSRFCLGVMEAAWLAAVCVIPIFFNIYSSRIFEPDKITILRSLALLTLAAWAIKLIDEGGVRWKAETKEQSHIAYLLKYPLIAPVIGLVIVYIISTIFSVTPSISFFGSWQRLQGTYTTFSYLIIFLSIIVNLRKREQIHRLITTVIFTSLPISFYGVLQRLHIDPIPWGGNVSVRIAANMGNSIFVAAYLIMVFPLTVGRLVETFGSILSEDDNTGLSATNFKNIVRGTIYVVIAALQLVAIYLSGSRGPLLGLLAGVYFMVLLFSIYWRKKGLIYSTIGIAILGAIFLVVFNMSGGPLEALRSSSYIGRFGNLLNPESNSALVRQYIWEGTVKLVNIHAPLKFPDGSTDKFNFLRPIFGYGPETMYVAYNQFYQPELGQVEKRNASPDRSHNETWDSIVITGLSGLLVYLSIFSSVFYYGLKWQGLIKSKRNALLFFICLVGGGVIGTIAMILIKGVEYLGVGLPFGMIVGVVIYLTGYALLSNSDSENREQKNLYTPLIIVLLSAIVGHFVEINFGIAIVATRTLFWTYTGLILVTGFVLPKMILAETQLPAAEATNSAQNYQTSRKKGRSGGGKFRRNIDNNNRPLFGSQPDWMRNTMIGTVILGTILATLGYDYLTNSSQSTSFISIIINSFTRLSNNNNAVSYGIFTLIFITWVAGSLLFASETADPDENHTWLRKLGIIGAISLLIGVIFWLIHSISLQVLAATTVQNEIELIAKVNNIGSLLTKYYIYIFLILVLIAFLLPEEWPGRSKSSNAFSIILIPVALIFVFIASNVSNLKVIGADINFKMAEPFTKNNQWDIATILYKRSLELTPQEDHYYLFLGRSYLEQAKNTDSTSDQDNLVKQAENDLKKAQSINPLNTDHTANLARLYSWWAGKTDSNTVRAERAQKASDYYASAVTLSPNNSTLWDEWAVLFMQLLNQPQEAFNRLNHALQLDSKYSFTQGLLGDYYLTIARSASDDTSKERALMTAASYYRTAAQVAKSTDTVSRGSYLVSLGNVYSISASLDPQNLNRDQLQQAIDALKAAITAGIGSSDLWKVQHAIAGLYVKLGDKQNAQFYANEALQNAPEDSVNQIEDLITQTQSMP